MTDVILTKIAKQKKLAMVHVEIDLAHAQVEDSVKEYGIKVCLPPAKAQRLKQFVVDLIKE